MNVHFTTKDFGDEAASLAAAEAGRELPQEYYIFGEVILQHPGQPDIAIYDDLPFLVADLCVRVPARLLDTGQAAFHLIDSSNAFKLVRDGDQVHLQGGRGEAATYPEDELITALRGCGARFATFLEHAAELAPQFMHRVESLRADLNV